MTKKLTINEIYNYCKENKYDLPVINQEYYSNRIPIRFICPKHGEYSQRWTSHKRGSTGCKICRYNKTSKSNRLSWDSLIKMCKDKGYDIPLNKNEYKNQNSLMTFKCDKHGIYKQCLDSHMQGKTGCKKCEFIRRQQSRQEWDMCKIKEYCISHKLDIPQKNQQYKNEDTKYIFICPKYGEYEQSWEKHKLGQGCYKCKLDKISKLKTKSCKQYYGECKENNIDLPIEYYISDSTPIKHKCSRGHIYSQTPSNHLQGQGCPICNESHGERFIRNYLDEHNIEYIPQKKFKDLKDKTYLSYDFYLPDHNILIEYQGIQHYESISFNNKDKTDLEKQQYHDSLKRQYAKDNGYKLLELHYSLDTQEKVNKYLNQLIKG